MCGVAGIYGYANSAPPVDRGELLKIRDAMQRRGPDGAGLWISAAARTGLAHRRLSIIDLSDAAAQPMAGPDGRLHVTFNGEIYNHLELRRELEAKGVRFRTNSDTEVLLHLYADRGKAMLAALRGMYAFAIWDERERTLFLARDPFGIKPLYYADDGRTFRCASQVKALLAGGAVDRTGDPAGRAGFALWGYVPEPFTLYRGIRALPAGCSMVVDAGGAGAPEKFFDLAAEFREAERRAPGLGREAGLERLQASLRESVSCHMLADVPVGVFLSAGVDSTVIATLAARTAGSELTCVTLGFDEYRGGPQDETVAAGQTAERLGVRHAVDWIGQEAFYEKVVDVLEAMDQPSIDGINTYFVSRAAARQGLKVALSGLGADELFLGYPSFRDVPQIMRMFGAGARLPRWVGRAARAAAAPVLHTFTSPKYAGLLEYGGSCEGAYLLRRGLFMPWELPGLMGRDEARAGLERLHTLPSLGATRDGVRGASTVVSNLELAWYMRGQLLRDADWAGMAHSLEIRVPFVDLEVLRAAAPLAAAGAIRTKRDFASLPGLGLPRELAERPKTGFQVPVGTWLDAMAPVRGHRRGLRGWGVRVDRHFTGRRAILNLMTDAYGAHGGIALYGRDFLAAQCGDPATEKVVAIVRNAPDPATGLPAKLRFDTSGSGSKVRFVMAVARVLLSGERFDLVVCGHIHLLPLAAPLAARFGVPLMLVVYGVDAWRATPGRLANAIARRVDVVNAVSNVTMGRFRDWSGVAPERCSVLPNAIHMDRYGMGPKDASLVARYGLQGRKVIMTLARYASNERYKGVDEVLAVLPRVMRQVPEAVYLIVGDGTDRPRLESVCRALGLAPHVVFAGRIPEAEKADHFRLADAFVMPSRGEGFGFVFLEAMACGIPVVGGRYDGSADALGGGAFGRLVDPENAAELETAILDALRAPKGIPKGMEVFAYENFERGCRRFMARTALLCG